MSKNLHMYKVRTVTCFVNLNHDDFVQQTAETKLGEAVRIGKQIKFTLEEQSYEVQTVRIATNPFPEWLSPTDVSGKLERIDNLMSQNGIDFCALGPGLKPEDIPICISIVEHSHRFSCSASLRAKDVNMATAIARGILKISKLDAAEHLINGLGNFRFCATTSKPYIPFFPAARSEASAGDVISFAVGLENGALVQHLLSQCGSAIDKIENFKKEYAQVLQPLQSICDQVASTLNVTYLGMDTSLNPSLDESGSVAHAMELFEQVKAFGGPGSLAAAACITEAIQSLPNIKLEGYCGLMLPLCEDLRLAELSATGSLTISKLLSISHVCGVGVDTVPIPGDSSEDDLLALLLDVAAVASRWNKSLSCRVFPIPGKLAGDMTEFDSPHMVNARVLPIE